MTLAVHVDSSELRDVVKNVLAKKFVYEKLDAKVNNLDTSESVLKTKYQTELEKKNPNFN